MNSSIICKGCLSTNRKLSVINVNDYHQVFASILENSDYVCNQLALCWECSAIIKKITKFKRQVQNAHRYLISSMLHQTKLLPSLSNLTTHTNTQEFSIISLFGLSDNSSSLNTNTKRINKNDSLCNVQVLEDAKSNIEKEIHVETANVEREPIFIKVELENGNNFEQELETREDFDNPKCNQDLTNNFNNKDVKLIFKTDSMDYDADSNYGIKSDLDFNDSDNEPLKKKKEKVKGRRRKKDKDEVNLRPVRADKSLIRLGIPPGTIQPIRLTWQEVEDERRKVLSSESYRRYPHRCDHCAIGFNHTSKLLNHMKKHHVSAGQLSCSLCKVRCRTQHALAAHTRRHLIRWRCCLCGELGSRAAVIADHCARVHGATTPAHACTQCPHVAPTLSKLRNHLKNHAERQKCELCGKTFRDKSTLKTHLFIHKGEKEHACPTCGKLFLFKKAMQLHRATHDAPSLLYCHQCDMNFKNQMSYYQHMKYNLKHVDPARLKYTCGDCGKKFMKASRLAEHNTALHLKLTPVRCTQEGCNFACASRPVLRAHMRAAHRSSPAPRNHVCHHCGKTYTNKKTLEGHLRSHTGERPYSCTRCGATFTYHAALYNHTRLVHHTNKSSRRAPANTVEVGSAWTVAPPSVTETTEVPE